MELPLFFQWLLEAMLVGIAGYGVHVLSELQKDVSELNKQIAVILERMSHYNERLVKLERKEEGEE